MAVKLETVSSSPLEMPTCGDKCAIPPFRSLDGSFPYIICIFYELNSDPFALSRAVDEELSPWEVEIPNDCY